MKPSNLPAACSSKARSTTSCISSPCLLLSLSLLEMLPQSEHIARTTEQRSCEKQQARTSLQLCFHAWPCFIPYIPRRHFNYRAAAQGQTNEVVTCQNNQPYSDLLTIAGMRSAKGREKACPADSHLLFTSGKYHSEGSAELCKAVSLLVLLRSTTQSRQK